MDFNKEPYAMGIVWETIEKNIQKKWCGLFFVLFKKTCWYEDLALKEYKRAVSKWGKVGNLDSCLKWHKKYTPFIKAGDIIKYYKDY